MDNKFKKIWEENEKIYVQPQRLRKVIHKHYSQFSKLIWRQDNRFLESIVESLYAGDLYILHGAFSKFFMDEIQRKTMEFYTSKPSQFFKMVEGTPDFHRVIDEETGKKYSFKVCKHSSYFYPWNNDPLDLFETIYHRWRDIKLLMGLNPWEYKTNTPKDGVVDRIQIAQYPSKIGFLETHSDPYLHQRLFFSGYMSQRGVDYEGGGFYLIGQNGERVEVEDEIKVGDVGIGYATLHHGVAQCNLHLEPDWESDAGRWFLSMYSNASDEIQNRHTGHPVKENYA